MPTLYADWSRSSNLLHCSVGSRLTSDDQATQWKAFIEIVVHYAFLSRPATLMTIHQVPESLGHGLPAPQRLETNEGLHLINKIQWCTAELLQLVVRSEEFQRGLISISKSNVVDDVRLATATLQSSTAIAPIPPVEFELIILLDDGQNLSWFHPCRSPMVLIPELKVATETVGWTMIYKDREVNNDD